MSSFENLFSRYNKIIFFDTETTGLSATNCQIIELAMYIMQPSGYCKKYDRFVKLPEGEHVPEKIVEITGITDETLKDGITESEAAWDLFYEIDNQNVLMVAHNCQFDMCFVREMMRRTFGKEQGDRLISSRDWLDSLTAFKDRAEYPHKLCNAIEHYGITDAVNSHRAIDDTIALCKVCAAMDVERQDLNKYINIFGYNPKYGVSGEKLDKITYLPQPYVNGITPADNILPYRI